MSTPSFGGASKPKMSSKKRITLFAVGGVAGLAGVLYFRHKSASAATTASTGASGTDQSGIDPNTGIPYADEYNTGLSMDSGAYGTSPGALGTYNPLTGQYTPGLGSVTTPVAIASNAEWAQAAVAALVADGYDPATVAGAIGAYLLGSPLNSTQYGIVQAAIGLEGQPPNGAPPITQTGGGGGTGSTGGTSTGGGTLPTGPPVIGKPLPTISVTVPNVTGARVNSAIATLAARGLRYKSGSGNRNPVKTYTVTGQTPRASTKVSPGSSVTLTWKVGK